MGSIVGHRIDYNGVGVLRGQQNLTQVLPPPTGFLAISFKGLSLYFLALVRTDINFINFCVVQLFVLNLFIYLVS